MCFLIRANWHVNLLSEFGFHWIRNAWIGHTEQPTSWCTGGKPVTCREITILFLSSESLNEVSIFTGRNEVVAKVMFLQVSASVHAGIPAPPPRQTTPPPDQINHPPDQAYHSPLGPGIPPPPRTRQTTPPGPGRPPPQKQTPAYGLRAAGTHPTGMHSCLK